jgi:hypothetical protein
MTYYKKCLGPTLTRRKRSHGSLQPSTRSTQGLLTGLIAALDIDTAAPNWLKRLEDADAGATIVRAVLARLGVTEHNYVAKHSRSQTPE